MNLKKIIIAFYKISIKIFLSKKGKKNKYFKKIMYNYPSKLSNKIYLSNSCKKRN